MVSLNIIIPCHIDNLKRIDKFYKCMMSLINQTNQADILISIGFTSSQLKPLFTRTIQSNEIDKYPHISLYYHDQPKSQFEHFYFLSQHIKSDYVMFCDNDDMYTIKRVEKFYNLIKSDEQNHSIYLEKQEYFHPSYNEYPMHVVKATVFKDFLNKSKKWHYHKYCDMLFSKYLQNKYYENDTITVNDKLYLYIKSNDDSSITSRNRRRNENKGTTVVSTYEDLQKYWDEQYIIMKDNLFVIMITNPTLNIDSCIKKMMGPNYENNCNLMPSRIHAELTHDHEYKTQHLLPLIN